MRRVDLSRLCVPSHLIGTAAIILFIVLLLVRLDFFTSFETKQTVDQAKSAFVGENWFEITQNGQKIGYAHRRLSRKVNELQFSEDILMRINTMGVIQPIKIRTVAGLEPDGEIINFQFVLHSNLFQFNAEGHRENRGMVIRVGNEKNVKVLPLSEQFYMGSGVLEAAAAGSMKAGESRTFHIFDPVTLSPKAVTITVLGEEALKVMGKEVLTKKISVEFHNMKQFAWVSTEGLVVREEGILGLVLETVTRKEALSELDSAGGTDLTMIAAIPSPTLIENPAALKRLKIRLINLPSGDYFLAGGRQQFADGILTVTEETCLDRTSLSLKEKVDVSEFLKSTPFIQAGHPKIVQKASEIVSRAEDDLTKAQKLVAWVYKNIKKRPVFSVPDAVETLENMSGDCNEHAVLLAALARAVGLPAEMETGLVYMQGKFFFHAWNVFYIRNCNGWITADASLGQLPADVTHLRFIRGALEKQANLAALIGNLKLDIVEMEK